MFCRFCGTELKDDAAFCKKCGKKIITNINDVSDKDTEIGDISDEQSDDVTVQYAKQGVNSNIYEKIADSLIDKVAATNTQRVNAQQFAIIFKKHILDNCNSNQLDVIKKTTQLINMGWEIEVGDYRYYARKSCYWIKCYSTKEVWQLKQDILATELANFKTIAKKMIAEKENV